MAQTSSTTKINSFKSELFMLNGDTLTQIVGFKEFTFGETSMADVAVADLDGGTGFNDNGQKTIGGGTIVTEIDPRNETHAALKAATDAEALVTLVVGSSESGDAATYDTSTLTLPTTRTWWKFDVRLKIAGEPVVSSGSKVMRTYSFNRVTDVIETLSVPA